MKRFGVLPTAVACGAMMLACVPALADVSVGFDYSNMHYTYDAASGSFYVSDNADSNALFDTRTTPGPAITDNADILQGLAGDFDVLLELTITGGSGVYSASGTFDATDADTSSSAIEADFTSSIISLDASGRLTIGGILRTRSGNGSILVKRESSLGAGDWVYAGLAAHTPNSPDADGTDGTIAISDPENYDTGELLVLQFGTGFRNIDIFFNSNRWGDGGNTKGAIVPAPGAALLGLMGFAMIGRVRRRLL